MDYIIKIRNLSKKMKRMNMKPNFAALGREYGCDYRTVKKIYIEKINKEKGITVEKQAIKKSKLICFDKF